MEQVKVTKVEAFVARHAEVVVVVEVVEVIEGRYARGRGRGAIGLRRIGGIVDEEGGMEPRRHRDLVVVTAWVRSPMCRRPVIAGGLMVWVARVPTRYWVAAVRGDRAAR